MEFEWGANKAKLNLRKHGIPFTFSTRVFLDAYRIECLNNKDNCEEIRWLTVGLVEWMASRLPCAIRLEAKRFALSLRERRKIMKEKNTGLVNFRLALDELPKLTTKQKECLESLKDEDIDYSDIPHSLSLQWTRPGALISSENKKQVTLRLDTDVLNFFRTTGKRYQSRINAVLREYMESHF